MRTPCKRSRTGANCTMWVMAWVSLLGASDWHWEFKFRPWGYLEYRPSGSWSLAEAFVDDGMFDPRTYNWDTEQDWEGIRNATKVSSRLSTGKRALTTTSSSSSSNCGTATSSSPCCIECFGLSHCDVLNGYKVEDKYYPTEPTILGSCDNIESRASRLDVFGPAKTFRDTDACKEMVYDYTCLWWGSDNEMYDNRCGADAQVYPCRSYCVQLAKTCANHVEWLNLCEAIECPPTEETCVPGPYPQDKDEACYLYKYTSPLSVANRRTQFDLVLYAAATIAVAIGGSVF